jgi:uncharacterized glyoxalase superfamily protein PhnB
LQPRLDRERTSGYAECELVYIRLVTAILLGYVDLDAARNRFTDWLAFEETFVATDEAGVARRSHVHLGDTTLLLDSPRSHGIKRPHDVDGVTPILLINVGDLDLYHKRAQDAGASGITTVADGPWAGVMVGS